MIKHYCSNCFQVNLSYERCATGICPHCKLYVLMAKNTKEAKVIYNAVHDASAYALEEIDKETNKLIYGTAYRGTIVTKKNRKAQEKNQSTS